MKKSPFAMTSYLRPLCTKIIFRQTDQDLIENYFDGKRTSVMEDTKNVHFMINEKIYWHKTGQSVYSIFMVEYFTQYEDWRGAMLSHGIVRSGGQYFSSPPFTPGYMSDTHLLLGGDMEGANIKEDEGAFNPGPSAS